MAARRRPPQDYQRLERSFIEQNLILGDHERTAVVETIYRALEGDAMYLSVMCITHERSPGDTWTFEVDADKVAERQRQLEPDPRHTPRPIEQVDLSLLLGQRHQNMYKEMVRRCNFLIETYYHWVIVHTRGTLRRANESPSILDVWLGRNTIEVEVDEYRLEIDFALTHRVREQAKNAYKMGVLYTELDRQHGPLKPSPSTPSGSSTTALTQTSPKTPPPSPSPRHSQSRSEDKSIDAKSTKSGHSLRSVSSSSLTVSTPPPPAAPTLPRIAEHTDDDDDEVNANSSSSTFSGSTDSDDSADDVTSSSNHRSGTVIEAIRTVPAAPPSMKSSPPVAETRSRPDIRYSLSRKANREKTSKSQ